MRLPQLTADRAIGPAVGTYILQPAPGSTGPSVVRGPRSLRPQANGDIWDVICNEGEIPCWGQSGTDYEIVNICCDARSSVCGTGAAGAPICVPIPPGSP
jgi:hypothetical protein